MTVSSQSFFVKKCALMAMTMTALTVNANPVDTGLGFAANGGNEGEVGVSGRQLDDEGLIVGASNTAELGSVTGK